MKWVELWVNPEHTEAVSVKFDDADEVTVIGARLFAGPCKITKTAMMTVGDDAALIAECKKSVRYAYDTSGEKSIYQDFAVSADNLGYGKFPYRLFSPDGGDA